MRTLHLAALVLPAIWTMAVPRAEAQQARRFPYRATIESDEVYVRSGPGKRFYATGKLRGGDEVVVHRHDPGGWYMIAPPPGSFSWIREEYVQFQGGSTGVVQENNVVVRVGTEYGEVRDVEQRRLSKGDRVQILARQTVRGERGDIALLKISPPAGEYRWVNGRGCMPAERGARVARDRDPYATPTGLPPEPEPADCPVPDAEIVDVEPETDPLGGFEERPLVRVREGDAIADRRPDPAAIARERQRLHAIDVDFKEMVEQDPTKWDLEGLQRRYRNLQRDSKQPSVAGAIPARLAAVKRYEKIEKEYVAFVQLTRSTADRDAALVSLQRTRRPVTPTPATTPAANPIPSPQPNLSGAGIVQRVANTTPGGPSHVLLHPRGRILAYLRGTEGVDLDSWLGRQAGVAGPRRPEPSLQGDLIDVESVVPVQLAP